MSSRPWTQPAPDAPLIGVNEDDGRRKHPTGACHGCGRWVPGERRFCGGCAARKERTRDR